MTLNEMTDADKVMNPQHFGSDPADTRIRIRINPEQGDPWQRFALPEHSLALISVAGLALP